MCIRDSPLSELQGILEALIETHNLLAEAVQEAGILPRREPVSYTHLRAHETVLDLVCRLLLEKKKQNTQSAFHTRITSPSTITYDPVTPFAIRHLTFTHII